MLVQKNRIVRLSLALSLLTALAGCGKATEFAGAKVSGTVTLNGDPLNGGVVLFVPSRGKGQGGSGQLSSKGVFEINTSTMVSGIEPGEYNVFVSVTDDMADQGISVPAKYNDPANPELVASVSAGGTNEFKFELAND